MHLFPALHLSTHTAAWPRQLGLNVRLFRLLERFAVTGEGTCQPGFRRGGHADSRPASSSGTKQEVMVEYGPRFACLSQQGPAVACSVGC